jgi:prolipoprotein diacylglyceryl transferase
MLHWYGFILGLAGVAGYWLALKQARLANITESVFDRFTVLAVIFGLIGARLWHITTDFYLYRENLLGIFAIWQGGLSIFGAIVGGLFGLWLAKRWFKDETPLFKILDCIAFGLPIAQVIGRLGNYFNQELYGLPTALPWGIAISPTNRAVSFEKFSYFHPLFAYEAVLVLIGWLTLSWLKKKKLWQIGNGSFFKFYLLYYLIIRFCLDFLRVQKSTGWLGLGINQLIILGILIGWLVVKQANKVDS